jgi:hypothetical protein
MKTLLQNTQEWDNWVRNNEADLSQIEIPNTNDFPVVLVTYPHGGYDVALNVIKLSDFNQIDFDTIPKIREWYASLPIGFGGLAQLIYARQKLSAAISIVSDEAGQIYKNFETIEGKRKIKYAEKFEHYCKEDSNMLSKEKATTATKLLLEEEKKWKGAKKQIQVLLDAARSLENALASSIRDLEREAKKVNILNT